MERRNPWGSLEAAQDFSPARVVSYPFAAISVLHLNRDTPEKRHLELAGTLTAPLPCLRGRAKPVAERNQSMTRLMENPISSKGMDMPSRPNGVSWNVSGVRLIADLVG